MGICNLPEVREFPHQTDAIMIGMAILLSISFS